MKSDKLIAIIVDDEEKARNMLQVLLDEHCPVVKVVAHCKNVPEAVAAIKEHKPQVVFLDVDMPGYSGFQLLDFFTKIDFEIIFTTAFSEYALQAFRVSAIDFLLKPIDIDQLIDAVAKVKLKKSIETYNHQLDLIRDSYNRKKMETIALSTADAVEFVRLSDIVTLKAERAYTMFYLSDGKQIMASKNIREFEELLNKDDSFFRIHRSHVINLNHVARFIKTDGGNVEMKNGMQVPVSKDAKDVFLSMMKW